ncbi:MULTISPECIES: hypothetical protein [Cupriavidus]|jgi:hypothetical protein|uniref:hypothetical protein n=1 Tax=Cupriavidus TaxID=106589 RepID=UPI0012E0AE7A|nr:MULTISPECIES: hypothetical protein [Cupriavidus]QWC87163.1 hypothetical protein KB891_08675 [Cupriavidus metallidurans]
MPLMLARIQPAFARISGEHLHGPIPRLGVSRRHPAALHAGDHRPVSVPHLFCHPRRLSGTTHFAEAVARQCDGVFVPLPKLELQGGRDELSDKQQELLGEIGTLFNRFREFTADGEIDCREDSELHKVADEVHRSPEEFLAVSTRLYGRRLVGKADRDE